MTKKKLILPLVTSLTLLLLCILLTISKFSTWSLQMDFSAFYTAGQSLNHGLSPYINYFVTNPNFWDGVNQFQHSRFLYSPLIGQLFRIIAILPYHEAKTLWTTLNILAIVWVLWFVTRKIFSQSPVRYAGYIVILLCFYPLITYLERGQIDVFIYLLLILGWRLHTKGMWSQIFASFLISIAILIKLHTVLILCYFLYQGKYRFLVLFGSIFISLSLLSILISPQITRDYVTNILPRISRYGEGGTPEMRLNKNIVIPGFTGGYTSKDGIVYKQSGFDFIANASLSRFIHQNWPTTFFPIAPWYIQLIVIIIGVLPLVFIRLSSRQTLDIKDSFILYNLLLLIVMLAAPLSWTMNMVWYIFFLPAVIYMISYKTINNLRNKTFHLFLIVGFSMNLIPDWVYIRFLTHNIAETRYIMSLVVLFIGILIYLLSKQQKSVTAFEVISKPE